MVSCGGPDALVINTVHPDGSVSRKIILTNSKDEFNLPECQVPVDSTWTMKKELEISEKGDTTWTLTAEKLFSNVDSINSDYKSFGGSNKLLNRWAEFSARFRWFNTIYRYSENVEHAIDGILPEDFFTPEELHLYFMPDAMVDKLLSDGDSAKIITLSNKGNEWLDRSLGRAIIKELILFSETDSAFQIDEKMIERSEDYMKGIELFPLDVGQVVIDSAFGEGFYERNKIVIDSAMKIVENKFEVVVSTEKYLVQTIMPGELVSTNGYIDNDGNITWQVKGETILSSDYHMWAESRVVNTWAWIVSFGFMVFVAAGLIIRVVKRKRD